MDKFGLIGYPLGHSMSPFIHNELFKINGIEAVYELKEISPKGLYSDIEELKSFRGFNVTIPHKTAIIKNLDGLSQRAALFGAVNTVANQDGILTGYNTDCFGFLRALDMAEIKLGKKVLLCGSGGVSRMFAFESVLAGAELTVAVRDQSIEKANKIKSEIQQKLNKSVNVVMLEEVTGEYDVLINGTPVGMYPDIHSCILPFEKVKACKAVFDAVYNPLETMLIKYAKQSGARYSNGLSMLVWQAAVAQEIWFDVQFTMPQIEAVMSITQKELEKR